MLSRSSPLRSLLPALLVPSLLAPACGGALDSTSDVDASPPPGSSETRRTSSRDGGSRPSDPPAPTSACSVPDRSYCDVALDVATSDEAVAEIVKLAEASGTFVRPPSGEALRPTRDLHATADIEIAVDDVQRLAPVCAEDAGKCDGPWFTQQMPFPDSRGAPWPEGVTCVESDPTTKRCSKIRVAKGHRVRFQRLALVSHWNRTADHSIRVVAPCAQPCAEGEAWCVASRTCIPVDGMCTLCEGHPPEVCACRIGCASRAEGDECEYSESEDVLATGKCSHGLCQ